MKFSQLSNQLSNLENRVKPLEINKQLYISPTVNAEYQDSTSLREPSPSESRHWESRISNLETNWAQFLQINDKTNQEMENLLNTAGFIKSEGSGLTDETDELTNLPPSLEDFASLCDIITKSIYITIVITIMNTIALCILGPTLNKTKKQLKRIIEKKSPKREAPEKGLITAALRPHKRETSRPRARNREQTYKIYPTKGINQDSPHLPHNFVPIITGL